MPKFEDFSLRRLQDRDLDRVLEWRNSDRVRAGMFDDGLIDIEEHRAWFERIRNSSETVYLIFEHHAVPLGVVNFTHIDPRNNKSFWGFYLGAVCQPAGMGSALGYLGLSYGFDGLRLRKVIGEVLCSNPRSITLHQKLGFIQEGHYRAHVLKNGAHQDVLSFALLAEDWHKNQSRLFELIFSHKNVGCIS